MIAGGTGSVLGGGKFGNGATTAAFQYLFNQMASEARQAQSGVSAGEQLAEQRFSGEATYYNLPGNNTASGAPFDPNADAAAMYQKGVRLGDQVRVELQSDPSRSVDVIVNDTGPFARGSDGRALRPLQADPRTIIDLTPHAFKELTGDLRQGRVPVTVIKP
jgi:rare lipoprotein A (peptidoglycan hydrolase)